MEAAAAGLVRPSHLLATHDGEDTLTDRPALGRSCREPSEALRPEMRRLGAVRSLCSRSLRSLSLGSLSLCSGAWAV